MADNQKPEPQGGQAQGQKPGQKPAADGGSPKIDRRTMAQNYGFALAFMNSNPELKHLFNKAVAETWTPDKFIAQLRNTKWFKSNSATVRNAILQETSDPATFQASLDQMSATVQDTYGSMFGDMGNDKQMARWARLAVRMGWSQAELVDKITASVDYQKMLKRDSLGGTAAEMKAQLDSLGSNYGIKLGDQWKARQLAAVMSGDDTIAGVQAKVQEMAMREYKAFADRIAGGETVTEIADPYISRYAELLEQNPSSVGLDNELIQRAMKQTGPDGKAASMDLFTFEKEVRKDNRWQYTQNAKQEVSNVTSDLLKSFGMIS